MAEIVNKGDVKKIVIGSNSYNVYDDGARTDIASIKTEVAKKANSEDVTTELGSYVKTTVADGKYETKANVLMQVTGLNDQLLQLDMKFSDAFSGVRYDSSKKQIIFTPIGIGGTEVSIDATDFIKDGMVDSVSIGEAVPSGATDSEKKTCLIITFNQAAGKEAINLEISKIFNADNYYTKAQTDKKLEDAVGEIGTAITETGTNHYVLSTNSDSVKVRLEAVNNGNLGIAKMVDGAPQTLAALDLSKSGTLAYTTDIPAVVQVTGTDTTKVMSQKAVSDAITNATKDIATETNVKSWISTAKSEAIAAIPTNVSALSNDAGYISTCFVSYDAAEKVLTLK